MAKFYGNIGFADTVETSPDVYEEQIVEKAYRGDVLQNYLSRRSSDKMNDDVEINNSISIVADPYLNNNMSRIRYVVWMGNKWEITSVKVDRPRLVLSIGGLYNE